MLPVMDLHRLRVDVRLERGDVVRELGQVDTAGGSEAFRVDVPYLGRDTAAHLHDRLATAAAETAFRW
jgi:hypothetical protein